MKKTISLVLIIVFSITWWYFLITNKKIPAMNNKEVFYNKKIYTSNNYSINIVDPEKKTVIKNIMLSKPFFAKKIEYDWHNIQISPDKKLLAVTANVLDNSWWDQHGWEWSNNIEHDDEIIIISTTTDEILYRIPLWSELHLWHVVFHPYEQKIYITSDAQYSVYEVDLSTKSIIKKFPFFPWAWPHWLRFYDENNLYVALEGYIANIDLKNGTTSYIPVNDKAVQVATTSGKVYASLYSSKRIAVYDTNTRMLSYLQLPSDSQWPIQLYINREDKKLYVADQWYYFWQLPNNKVYWIDPITNQVNSYDAENGTHGVVTDSSWYVYVSNLLSWSVTIINPMWWWVLWSIVVWESPNWITIWEK